MIIKDTYVPPIFSNVLYYIRQGWFWLEHKITETIYASFKKDNF